ncbi:uncharacterized protein LOC134999310 [Pseudophryne corroboree]|uniref:uncharacterized protein LOC134999310 n=1 Tax=Pseudophryne corroboree TaxID=495146 RepID=UPI0030815BDB
MVNIEDQGKHCSPTILEISNSRQLPSNPLNSFPEPSGTYSVFDPTNKVFPSVINTKRCLGQITREQATKSCPRRSCPEIYTCSPEHLFLRHLDRHSEADANRKLFPTSVAEWQAIEEDFDRRWNFPNCGGGAIDRKYVRITKPTNSGSDYFNYKGYFSIVLMAVVNANYEFIFLDVGKNGRCSDDGSLKNTRFYDRLTTNSIHLPPVEQTKNGVGFVFVADEAFALHEHIMKPYPQRVLNPNRRIFNYRLSRARRVVENAFGILSNRFRIFHKPINMRLDKLDCIVTACCILHNMLHPKATRQMPLLPAGPEDPNQPVVTALISSVGPPAATLRGTARAKEVRKKYNAFFNGEGAMAWQEECIR